MQAKFIEFGAIEIDGQRYERDVLITAGKVTRRSKKLSKPHKEKFGHTPVSIDEEIPWGGARLVIGTGAHGMLPVMNKVSQEARRRGVDLVVLPTDQACQVISGMPDEDVYAILHVTC